MVKRIDEGIRIEKLTIRVIQDRNIKLIIFRNDRDDTPHLTISWRNFSMEIDVHLKSRGASGQENHNTLAIIPEADFFALYKSIEGDLLKNLNLNEYKLRKVKPGWLARNGYVIVYLDENAQRYLTELMAPNQKRKGKWTRYINLETINAALHSQEIANLVYHPSILHEIADRENPCQNSGPRR